MRVYKDKKYGTIVFKNKLKTNIMNNFIIVLLILQVLAIILKNPILQFLALARRVTIAIWYLHKIYYSLYTIGSLAN
ncbi:MAG: hypothetical protein N5P05_004547 (plasmid) [Chroococcopsis gigantea SAG 12.99]|nr:hypothetical protein [Chroococcopsis gigantea SAG 12.99]